MSIKELSFVLQKQNIGKSIRARRKYLGYSQEKLSRLTGIVQERISAMEHGDFDSLSHLSKVLFILDANLKLELIYPEGKKEQVNLQTGEIEVIDETPAIKNATSKLNK